MMLRNAIVAIFLISLLGSCISEQDRLKNKIMDLELKLNEVQFKSTPDSLYEALINMRSSYLMSYPQDTAVVLPYLEKNIENAQLIEEFGLAEEAILRYIDSFPDADDIPVKKFILALEVYESGMKRSDKARKVYMDLIETYPTSTLIPDVLYALEILDKSDQQIIDMLK